MLQFTILYQTGGFIRRQTSPEAKVVVAKGFSVLPHGQASTADVISKEIHHKLEGRQARKTRDELFNGGCEDTSNMSPFDSSKKVHKLEYPPNIIRDLC